MKKYQVIIIGAGSGGLVVAIGAAKAGKKVLLIERGKFGGDCTNFGCIPSKTLIAAARRGIKAKEALELTRQTVEAVRSHEEPPALEKLGITCMRGEAHFQNPHTLLVKDKNGTIKTVKGKKIILATGSSPAIPSIEGLQETPYHTNETIFSLKEAPETLAILGGGPIGCELAGAFSRLGSKVHLIHKHGYLLPREIPKAQKLIQDTFQKIKITLHFNQTITSATYQEGTFTIKTEKETLQTDALLIAIGRRPNIQALKLDAAEVRHSSKQIPTDRFGRTNQKHIFAIGDVCGGPYFTHLAEAGGRAVLTSLLLPYPFLKELPTQPIPRTTFTDPEIASCGLDPKQAQQLYGARKIKTYTYDFSTLDRAICERRTDGFITIVTKKWSSHILGITIAGPRAGEMLPTLTLAMTHRIPLRKIANLIFPYPTYSLAIRKAADMWLTQTLFSPFTKS